MTTIENRIVMDECNNICIQLQSRELDEKTLRSSPSFNSDSEPPSYFEALRIPQPQLELTNQEVDSKESSFIPNQVRHHYIRTQNLPASIFSNHNNMTTYLEEQKPSETYFVWSTFTTFYCFFVGIIALVLSFQVYYCNQEQNFQKAFSKSKLCRNVNVAGLFCGIIYLTIGIVICLLPRY